MGCLRREQPILMRILGKILKSWIPKDNESSPIQKDKVERDIFHLLSRLLAKWPCVQFTDN